MKNRLTDFGLWVGGLFDLKLRLLNLRKYLLELLSFQRNLPSTNRDLMSFLLGFRLLNRRLVNLISDLTRALPLKSRNRS